MPEVSARPIVLVIGGSDSSGGAGVSRDVQALAHFGVDAAIAVTAVTAQTDHEVRAIHHVPPEVIVQQIMSARAARPLAAIKIGMLGRAASVQAVLDGIADVAVPVVLDPVLMASSGRALLEADGVALLREQLLPRAAVLTPNLPEAALLLQCAVANDVESMSARAHALRALGARAVLLKGGHGTGPESLDVLASAASIELLRAPRVAATLRGTGCMLASGIAAQLAQRVSLLQACQDAKHYVGAQLQAAARS